ncbi:MAG: putative Rossmann-fold nucleotide-binding protein, partial [Francisellaceae bacterium]
PIILVNREFWGGLLDWIEGVMLKEGTVSLKDMNLLSILDTAGEIVEAINNGVSKTTDVDDEFKFQF